MLILALVAWANAGIVAGAAVSVLAAPPLAGLFRLGGQATRGLDVNLSDAIDPMREAPAAVLLAGAAFAVAVLVLATNVVTGLLVGGILPWMVSTAAAWGLLATLVLGFAYWPLAVDPARAGMRPLARARLAALLAFAHPVRLGALTLVLALILRRQHRRVRRAGHRERRAVRVHRLPLRPAGGGPPGGAAGGPGRPGRRPTGSRP